MSDLTRPDRGEALTLLTEKIEGLPDDEVAPYLTVCLGILAVNAPDVLTFLFNQADARLGYLKVAP